MSYPQKFKVKALHLGEITLPVSGELVNITPMMKAHNVRFANYLATERAREVLAEIQMWGNPTFKIYETRKGRHTGGTWVHPLLGQDVAQWINPALGVRANIALLQLMQITEQQQDRIHALEAKAVADNAVKQLEAVTPVLNAWERTMKATDTKSIGDAAKALQVPPRRLFAALRDHKFIMSVPGGHVPYQKWINSGHLIAKDYQLSEAQRNRIVKMVLVTRAGMKYISERIDTILPMPSPTRSRRRISQTNSQSKIQ